MPAPPKGRPERDVRALAGTVAVVALLVGLWLGRGPLFLYRASGWAALVLLLGALAATPVARLARRSGGRGAHLAVAASAARRWLGVGALVTSAVHGVAGLASLGPSGLEVDRYRHGALALALLVPLGLTSSHRLVRFLGLRAWKALHRAAYAALALAVLHVARAPFVPAVAVVAVAMIATALLAARPLLALATWRSEPARKE